MFLGGVDVFLGPEVACLTFFDFLVKNLQKLHMQRIKDSFFSDCQTLQIKTLELSRQITSLIKESDLKLKELSRAETQEASSEQSKYTDNTARFCV